MRWAMVPDHEVRHIWIDDEGTQHDIPLADLVDAGTPIDAASGNDMTYSHTEVALAAVWDFAAIAAIAILVSAILWVIAWIVS